jgi:purine-binding chemotaxis protein CheW
MAVAGEAFLVVRLDAVRLAFPLAGIERVVRAVAVTPVAGAPACLLGLVDVHGDMVPLFDTRRLLGLQPRPLQASDRFLLVRSGASRQAFLADEVHGTLQAGLQALPSSRAVAVAGVRGALRDDDGLVLVHDLPRFMAFDQALALSVLAA